MTDTGPLHARQEASPARDPHSGFKGAHIEPTDVSGWVGWIFFAAIIMILVGAFQVIEGLVGIFNSDSYHVLPSGLVVHLSYTVWGWTQLLLGVLTIAVAIGIMKGNTLARILAIVLAGISAITHLAFVEAYPIWSIIVIAIDVLVIYALAVHGRELQTA
jgi:hypothetical protein